IRLADLRLVCIHLNSIFSIPNHIGLSTKKKLLSQEELRKSQSSIELSKQSLVGTNILKLFFLNNNFLNSPFSAWNFKWC
ncbi:MAG: hypothetical protein NE330_21305, partial [Lentisphaeraceae bacterium]|nr:hypothetical protein [Lentisphaeraceae bacterium]